MSPTDQPSGESRKTFLRHYHMAAEAVMPIDSKSRREIELMRRRKRSRLVKWCAISLLLMAAILQGMLLLAKMP